MTFAHGKCRSGLGSNSKTDGSEGVLRYLHQGNKHIKISFNSNTDGEQLI